MSSALYIGSVGHVRLQPFRHAFSYRIFSCLIDLDDIPQCSIFGHNRFNLMGFHNRDHGDGSNANPKNWIITQLQKGGYAADDSWKISLLCFPRMLGFTFNPLAIYFCHDGSGLCRAILHQVSNTFGERHSYLLPATQTTIDQNCTKQFHVSPFMPVDGGYHFQLQPPGETLDIRIDYLAPDGTTRMIARQRGTRQNFTTTNLISAFVRHPLMTLRIVSAIHWQALKLWRKGATFYRKPVPPSQIVSSESFAAAYREQKIVESVS